MEFNQKIGFMENNNNNFIVRPVALQDARRVWEIRNQPVVRKLSNSDEEISFVEHAPWFEKKYFSGADNHCFVLESTPGGVIGYCRLDFDDKQNHYIISIALDPDFHGQGLGHKILSETLRQFETGKEIFAEIQKNNIPSLKLFKKNNFKVFKEDEKNYYLTLIKANG